MLDYGFNPSEVDDVRGETASYVMETCKKMKELAQTVAQIMFLSKIA